MSVGGYTALVDAIARHDGRQPAARSQVDSCFSDAPRANAGAAILGAWRSFVVVVVGAGIIWAFLTDRDRGEGRRDRALAVLVDRSLVDRTPVLDVLAARVDAVRD